MMITRRALLPATVLVTSFAGVEVAKAASPLKVVATADGPYVSRVIDLGAYGAPAQRRPLAEHNRDAYVLQVG
jgi:hypothetical protein